eukprot:jgi/Psemu1/19881/gm1.19881_g
MAVNPHSVPLPARNGKIFTPLTPSLTKKLVEHEEDLLKANLEVVFLSRTKAQNMEGNDLYLSGVVKHLKCSNFLYTMLDLESWDCFFFDSKEAGLVLSWLFVFENNNEGPDSKRQEEKGNKSDAVIMDKNVNRKADDKDTNGQETGLKRTGEEKEFDGPKLATTNLEQLNCTMMGLSLPKFPLIGGAYQTRHTDVMLEEQGPQITYATYQSGVEVNIHLGNTISRGLISNYVCSSYRGYQRYPGYQVWFKGDDGKGFIWWLPFFQVASDREDDSLMYNVSTVLHFYGKEAQEDEEQEDPSTPSESTDNKKNSEHVVSTQNDKFN